MQTVNKLGVSESELRQGKTYEFDTPDGSRTAEVDFSERGDFRIWFNGTFIHVSKTFKALDSRLTKLADKWGLEA
jgi:hypothetical protein